MSFDIGGGYFNLAGTEKNDTTQNVFLNVVCRYR